MENIKLGDLYLPKEKSKDIIELLAKKRNIKKYKSKSSDRLYNIFKKQSKNKKRIDDIREELKNPIYNILKSESKDIKIQKEFTIINVLIVVLILIILKLKMKS